MIKFDLLLNFQFMFYLSYILILAKQCIYFLPLDIFSYLSIFSLTFPFFDFGEPGGVAFLTDGERANGTGATSGIGWTFELEASSNTAGNSLNDGDDPTDPLGELGGDGV